MDRRRRHAHRGTGGARASGPRSRRRPPAATAAAQHVGAHVVRAGGAPFPPRRPAARRLRARPCAVAAARRLRARRRRGGARRPRDADRRAALCPGHAPARRTDRRSGSDARPAAWLPTRHSSAGCARSRPGDSLRQVHWRATARLGSPGEPPLRAGPRPNRGHRHGRPDPRRRAALGDVVRRRRLRGTVRDRRLARPAPARRRCSGGRRGGQLHRHPAAHCVAGAARGPWAGGARRGAAGAHRSGEQHAVRVAPRLARTPPAGRRERRGAHVPRPATDSAGAARASRAAGSRWRRSVPAARGPGTAPASRCMRRTSTRTGVRPMVFGFPDPRQLARGLTRDRPPIHVRAWRRPEPPSARAPGSRRRCAARSGLRRHPGATGRAPAHRSARAGPPRGGRHGLGTPTALDRRGRRAAGHDPAGRPGRAP